jgi:C1A family cysteine protease
MADDIVYILNSIFYGALWTYPTTRSLMGKLATGDYWFTDESGGL